MISLWHCFVLCQYSKSLFCKSPRVEVVRQCTLSTQKYPTCKLASLSVINKRMLVFDLHIGMLRLKAKLAIQNIQVLCATQVCSVRPYNLSILQFCLIHFFVQESDSLARKQ